MRKAVIKHSKVLSFIVVALALSPFIPSNAQAHPVSYQGAFAVMTWNQPFLSDYWITYSFRNDMAIAARAMRMNMDEGESVAYLPQFDYLLKRWNEHDSQGNVYVYAGFGGIRFDNRNGTAGLAGIEADWESRKYFVLGRFEAMHPTVGPNYHKAELRLGIAPYEAEFEEVASWFMVQAQYHPDLNTNYAITPLARFFYKNVLWETGVSLKGDWMLNLMFHF